MDYLTRFNHGRNETNDTTPMCLWRVISNSIFFFKKSHLSVMIDTIDYSGNGQMWSISWSKCVRERAQRDISLVKLKTSSWMHVGHVPRLITSRALKQRKFIKQSFRFPTIYFIHSWFQTVWWTKQKTVKKKYRNNWNTGTYFTVEFEFQRII